MSIARRRSQQPCAVERRFDNVIEVNFGANSPTDTRPTCEAYMWDRMKEWLLNGGIPADDEKLALGLASPGAHIRTNGQLVLESKESMQKRGWLRQTMGTPWPSPSRSL